MKKRIVALLMALSLLASVCVFTANADNPGVIVVNSASELLEALQTENAQIKLGSDIVFNEGITFAYDETNAVVTVSDANGIVAKVATGETEGVEPGTVVEGSLDGLTKWTARENLNGADIDGDGHTIKGLYVRGRGFAKEIRVGESIKNLKFENSLVYSKGEIRTATLAGLLNGDVYNVDFKNSYVIANAVPAYWIVGGAIADQYSTLDGTTETYNPTIDDVTFDGAVFANSAAADGYITAGGVVGHNKGGKVFNCENYGTVKVVTGKPYAAGGVIGLIEPTNGNLTSGPMNVYVYNAANYGKIVADAALGGVIGFIDPYWSCNEDIIIHNVYNAGELVGNGSPIIGKANGKHPEAKLKQATVTYGFVTDDKTSAVAGLSSAFTTKSVARTTARKALAFLNHGATAYEGLKTWAEVDGVLKMTDTKATYDGAFVAKDIETDTSFEDFVIESVKVLNEKELEIKFSEAATIDYQVTTFIRYTTNGSLAWADMNGDGTSDPLQFQVNVRHNGTDKMIVKLSSSVTTSLADILACKGFENSGYEVKFCLEGLTVAPGERIPGEIEEIKGVYSGKNLIATKPHQNGTYDGYYIDITDVENATVPYTADTALPEVPDAEINVNPYPTASLKPLYEDGIYIKSAKVINETQIEITFSEPVVKKASFFSALRYTDRKLALRTDSTLTDPNLQFYGGITLDGTDKGIFTYDTKNTLNRGYTLYDVLMRKGYEKSLYSVYLCIEGLPGISVEGYEYASGYIDNITSADGTKMLSAVVADNNAGYDKYYIAVTDGEKAKPAPVVPTTPNYATSEGGVKLVSAKVIDCETIELTFSEDVARIGGTFVGIRYTDINLGLRTDSTLEDPNLQFYPKSFTFNGNKATFVFNSERHGKSLADVLNLKGYEDKGWFVTFCLEGLPNETNIPNPVVGYIDNIVSATDPSKLLAATIGKSSSNGIYDGVYVPIEDVENVTKPAGGTTPTPPPAVEGPDFTTTEGGVKLVSVKAIDEVTLELTFSEPIKTVGYSFRGIRYTRQTLGVVKDGDRYLQFYDGSLKIDDTNKAKATWTFDPAGESSAGLSLYEILTLKGYEDKGYFVTFCFEGVPNETQIPNPQTGYVDNIQSLDGTKLLAANLPNNNGIYDGCYAPIDDVENAKKPQGGTTPTPPPSSEPIEVGTYAELANALTTKSNTLIKVTADLKVNEGVTYKYDAESGKVIVANGETVIAEFGTGKNETVAGELISGSIDSLTKWNALTIANGNVVDFQGHTVSGYVLSNSLFNSIDKSGALKNIKVENVFIYATGVASAKLAVLAGENRGVIDTATITDAVILAANCKSANVGMAVGFFQSTKSAGKEDFNPTINNVTTDGTIIYHATEGNPTTGGLVAKMQGGKLTNSVNFADVICTGTANYGTGGLVGLVEFDAGQITETTDKTKKTVTNIYIVNCANFGAVEGAKAGNSGGLIGFADLIWSVNSSLTLNNLYNGGKLTNCSSPVIAQRQGISSLGGGSISCSYLFANTTFANFSGAWAGTAIMKCTQEEALEYLNGNVGRLTAIAGDENAFAYAWKEEGDFFVPDAALEIPEIKDPPAGGTTPTPPPTPSGPPNYAVPEDSIKIESIEVLDYVTLEITFSEPIALTGNVFHGIRYTDNQFNLQRDSALTDPNLQFYGKFSINTTDKTKVTWTYDPTQNNGKSLYDVLTFKGYENKGWFVSFCIEGLPNVEKIPNPIVGYVDNVHGVEDPTKLLGANKPTNSAGIYDGCYAPINGVENAIPPEPGTNLFPPTVDMTPTEGGITILSAKVINETQIEITFSEPVKRVGGVWAGIRYTNSALKLAQDYALEDPYIQFYSTLKFSETDPTKATYTFSPKDNRCLYDIITCRGYESKGYYVYFCIEGLPTDQIPSPKQGYIDNIQSLDGTKLLGSNKPTSAAGVYDGYYIDIEDGSKCKPADWQPKPFYDVEVLSAKILNEREIEVTFSEPVRLVGDVFTAIRYVDANNNLKWDEGVPLHFITGERFNNSRKAILTLSADETLTMSEILAKAGYEDTDWLVKLCFEGLKTSAIKTAVVGYVDNVQTYDGRGMLVANKPTSSAGIYDGLYIDLEDLENATLPFTEATPLPDPEVPVIPIDPDILTVPDDSVKLVEAHVINSTQIKLVFSENIELVGSTFRAIRYVDRNLNLQWVNGQPLQWYYSESKAEGNTMTLTWSYKDISFKEVLNKKGYENSGYYVMFCIEGLPGGGITKPKVGYVDNIKGKSGKLLGANKPNNGGVYDGVYANITGLANLSKPGPKPGEIPIKNIPHVTVLSCKVINPSQIEIIFSEPVTSNGGCFSAIRYMNKDLVLQRDESLPDPYLQFTGGLRLDGTERAIWTLGSSSTKTLYELLNLKGYEKKGYYAYFCFEGLPSASTKEVGYVDNIVSVAGKKPLKCTPSKASGGGVYDGLYLKIEDVDKAIPIEVPDLEGIFIDQIEAISPYSLEFVFSEPVYIVGMGTAATQYNALKASVRYVDPKSYETITYNGRLMEFGADFYIEDGQTIGTFELRDQDTTFKNLFDMVGYEDLRSTAIPVLCLEGTEDMDLIPTPFPGYVDNVQNADGTNMLTAMIASGGGIYDCWIATADEINLEVRKTEIELLKELVVTDKMSKAELEAFAALDDATITKKLTKAKELLEALTAGEMTEAGVAAFNALLQKNGIDNAEKVKAMMFTVGEYYDIGLPIAMELDVRDREYDWSDTVYVYRVNADGSITEIAQKGMIVYVADDIITRITFADDAIGDYFVTNYHLELPKPFNPAIIAYIAIGVMVLALVVLVIFLASKKKKKA